MPKPDVPPPSFDERAISAILKRANELQETPSLDPRFGLTLDELQQAATEVGIDPHAVAQAAAEWQAETTTRPSWWGGPVATSLEQTLDVPLTGPTWEAVVAVARHTYGTTGRVQTWGHTYEWTNEGTGGLQAHLTATARDGQTHLQVFANEPALPAATFIPAGVIAIILLPIIFDSLGLLSMLGVGLYLALASMLFFVARWGLTRLIAKRRRTAQRLLTETTRLIERHAIKRAARAATTAVPTLDLDAILERDESTDRLEETKRLRKQLGR